jgi:hypothetical protein
VRAGPQPGVAGASDAGESATNLTIACPQATARHLEAQLAPAGIVAHRNYPANPNKQAMLQLALADAGQLQRVVAALAELARQPGAAM